MFLLLNLTLVFRATAQQYTNLALEGGGIRGIAYSGAFEELERMQVLDSIRQISGTSVGAIAGSLLAAGYSASEIKNELFGLKMQSFNDGRWFFLGGQSRTRKYYGWYFGDALERWVESRIAAKSKISHLTFMQLHELAQKNHRYKDLYVTASNLSKQRLEIFSWHSFPEMEIAIAVRTSMSIPLYFKAMMLDERGQKNKNGDVFVDGGLVMNYPLSLFDSNGVNVHTLGLKLERPVQIPYFKDSIGIAPFPIRNFNSYFSALYNLTIETLSRKWPMKDELFRTIYISTEGVNPRVRRISIAQKQVLYESGLKAARAFLNRNTR